MVLGTQLGVDQQQALCDDAARRGGGAGAGAGAGGRGAHGGDGGRGASVSLASDVALLIDALLHITS